MPIAMVTEPMHWLQLNKDQWELIKNLAYVVLALLTVAAAVVKVSGWARPRWRAWRDRKTLRQRVGAELYDREEIRRATTYYIHPDCQSVDPGGGEDFRRVVSARESLFGAVDRLLQNPGQYKFVILLADSGMGKTSFLLNYYAYHWRSRRRKRFQLALIPLNQPDSDKRIEKIPEEQRNETVLCLDALDEDRQAIQDHRQRLGALVSLAQGFRTVIITCRTQFFPKEEEIPTETGILRAGPVALNEAGVYYFHKLYLAPFTDAQVEKYLERRFQIWRHRERRAARAIVDKIPDLVARPMLLAHVPDLVNVKNRIDYSYQIYEEMVARWLEREKAFVQDSGALRDFSERLAVDLVVNRSSRQMERIPEAELKPLADEYGIHLEAWQLRGRSLLNRDAVGNYKFAHRSIMEYLFVRGFLSKDAPQRREPWTDLSKAFLREMILSNSADFARLHGADLSGVDLVGADLSGANLTETNLSGTDLRDADLSQANLSGADLVGANLSGANLTETNLSGTDLRDADLSQANLSEADLSGALLRGAHLIRANLSGANLNEGNLIGANLSGANLSGANLNEGNLFGANLLGANLSGAYLIRADLRSARGLVKQQVVSAIIGPDTKLDPALTR